MTAARDSKHATN